MIVVSNTSPICYLVMIGEAELLPALFTTIVIPQAVEDEIRDPHAPTVLQEWISHPPEWLDVRSLAVMPGPSLARLHDGEREAIALAEQLGADLVLLDEKSARKVAAERGLRMAGLLGILSEAASRGWVDLPTAIRNLQQTTFRASPRLLRSILERHRR